MLKATNLTKYLERHAEPEASRVAFTSERYAFAVVVPACGESSKLIAAWRAWATFLPAGERVLFVLVVNSGPETPEPYRDANSALLTELRGYEHACWNGSHDLFVVRQERCDVLVVDRDAPASRLPPKSGVGLARKIGGDLACACLARGHLVSPWWLSTDADVTLPSDLHRAWPRLPRDPGLACLPFAHVCGGDALVDEATFAVEVALRYHVAGLEFAASSYAWPALGSCLAVHSELYAAVRGFPRRLAGEDFYLLQKGSKLAPVWRLEAPTVEIISRRSHRTPFGTGGSVETLLRAAEKTGQPGVAGIGAAFTLRNPACYVELRRLLQNVRYGVRTGDIEPLGSWLGIVAQTCPEAAQVVRKWELLERLRAWCSSFAPEATRRTWADEWLDGLRQVQFLKAAERTFGSLPYRDALLRAPFVPADHAVGDIAQALARLR